MDTVAPVVQMVPPPRPADLRAADTAEAIRIIRDVWPHLVPAVMKLLSGTPDTPEPPS
jgi:hypothetical protein